MYPMYYYYDVYLYITTLVLFKTVLCYNRDSQVHNEVIIESDWTIEKVIIESDWTVIKIQNFTQLDNLDS